MIHPKLREKLKREIFRTLEEAQKVLDRWDDEVIELDIDTSVVVKFGDNKIQFPNSNAMAEWMTRIMYGQL